MWVIIVYSSLQKYRDDQLEFILNDILPNNQYLGKNGKFLMTSSKFNRLFWKTEKSVNKVIDEFNEWNKTAGNSNWSHKFGWIRNNFLVSYKVSREDWNEYIDHKVQIEKNISNGKISKLEKLRKNYKL